MADRQFMAEINARSVGGSATFTRLIHHYEWVATQRLQWKTGVMERAHEQSPARSISTTHRASALGTRYAKSDVLRLVLGTSPRSLNPKIAASLAFP